MRSVVVVLPASMCAAMPMLRVRSSVYSRLGELGDFFSSVTALIFLFVDRLSVEELKRLYRLNPSTTRYITLPAEMCKRLVGLGRSEEHTSELQSLRHLVC